MNKTLVLTGGGMRCAWSGGLMYGCYELGIHPKKILASSGNVGNAIYFVANQPESIRRIWTEHLPGNRFISFSRRKVIDIDFLVDTVFKIKEPIDWNTVRTSETRVICPLRAQKTGNVSLYTNENLSYEVMRASKAMPFVYGKSVTLNNTEYEDHPFTLDELLELLPINDSPLIIDTRERNLLLKMLGKVLTQQLKDSEKIASEDIIKPNIEAHLFTHSKEVLTRTFESGREFAHKNTSSLR